MANGLDFRFYKKKRIVTILPYVTMSIGFLPQTIEHIIDKEYFIGVVYLISEILFFIVAFIHFRQQINITKVPGLILEEQSLKFKLGLRKEYNSIKLNEIAKIEVPEYNDIIYIDTMEKNYEIPLIEYKRECRPQIKDKFRSLSSKIIN